MARFGEEFIRSLTSPSYSEGLFQLGSAISSAPATAMKEKTERTQLGMLRGMNPVQQAQYAVDNAKTAEELRVATGRLADAQQADRAQKQQQATLAVDQLKMVINDPMSSPQEIAEAQAGIDQINKDAGLAQSPTANLGSGVINTRTKQQLTEDANAAMANGDFKRLIEIGRLMGANAMPEGTALIKTGMEGLKKQTSAALEQKTEQRLNILMSDFSTNREAIRTILVEELGIDGLMKFNTLSKTFDNNKNISDNNIISTYASQALDYSGGPQAFLENLRATNPKVLQQFEGKIISQIKLLSENREEIAAFASTGVLTEEQLDYLDANPGLLNQNEVLITTYNNPSIPGQKRQSGMALIKLITEDRKRKLANRTSDTSIKIAVADTMRSLSQMMEDPSINRSTGFFNDDTFDAFKDIIEDEDKNREFQLRLESIIKENPDANIGEPQLRSILQSMGEKMPGNEQVDMLNEESKETLRIRDKAILDEAIRINPNFMDIDSEDERKALIAQATVNVDDDIKQMDQERSDNRYKIMKESGGTYPPNDDPLATIRRNGSRSGISPYAGQGKAIAKELREWVKE